MTALLEQVRKLKKSVVANNTAYVFETVNTQQKEQTILANYKDDLKTHLILLRLYDE